MVYVCATEKRDKKSWMPSSEGGALAAGWT